MDTHSLAAVGGQEGPIAPHCQAGMLAGLQGAVGPLSKGLSCAQAAGAVHIPVPPLAGGSSLGLLGHAQAGQLLHSMGHLIEAFPFSLYCF